MRLKAISFMVFTAVLLAACQRGTEVSTSSEPALAAASEPNTATLWVHGMGCPQCAYNVDMQLLKVPGVEAVKVDMGSGRVFAKISPENPPTEAQLTKAIDQTGFTLKKIQMPR